LEVIAALVVIEAGCMRALAGLNASSAMRKANVAMARIRNAVIKPTPCIEAISPTTGIKAESIIMLELKNDVAVTICPDLNDVLAICNPNVHAIPSGTPASRKAKIYSGAV